MNPVLRPNFGHLTTVSLYTVSSDGKVHGPLATLNRSGEAPAERFVEIGLAHPPGGWRSTSNLPDLDPTSTYELRAWSGNGNNRVRSFPFQLGELRSATADSSILTKEYVGRIGAEGETLVGMGRNGPGGSRCPSGMHAGEGVRRLGCTRTATI